MMSRVKIGVVAAFAATVVVSVLEAINMLTGPWATPFPHILAYMLGMPNNLLIGWIAHVVIGTVVMGAAFGVIYPRLPTDLPGTKGIAFSVAAFTMLIVGILMFGDPSIFSGSSGFMTVAWLLFSNGIFGFVMGSVYGRLAEREKRAAKKAGLNGVVPAH